jgi:serine/threonine protein kinase
MGAVYRGEHALTGRRVALKLVHVHWWMSDEVQRRFEREARIASQIRSKYVVQVLDAGRDRALGPFIVMELLEGEDLEQRLVRSGALPVQTACELALQVACGLEKAHAADIAHRDLKPGNIFLTSSDEEGLLAKVLDFGVAKRLDELPRASARLTHAGAVVGTQQYMSPEQGRGQLDVDARTDVYALGAVLYEMIVGRPCAPALPDHGAHDPLVILSATKPAPRVSASLPAVAPRLDQLVADMLEEDRRDRVQTMREVREGLEEILGHAPRLGSFAGGARSSGWRGVRSGGSSGTRVLAAAPVEEPRTDDPDREEADSFERESLPPTLGGPLRLAARFATRAETAIKVWRLSARGAATEVIGYDADWNVRARLEIIPEVRAGVETLLLAFHAPEEGTLRMNLDGTPMGEVAGVVDSALWRGVVRDLVRP